MQSAGWDGFILLRAFGVATRPILDCLACQTLTGRDRVSSLDGAMSTMFSLHALHAKCQEAANGDVLYEHGDQHSSKLVEAAA